MKLKELLVGLEELKVKGNLDIEINGIAKSSKEVKEGFLFVAIKGFSIDGHTFVEDAIKSGATAIMIQEGCDLKLLKIPEGVSVVMAKDTRKALDAANVKWGEEGKIVYFEKHNFKIKKLLIIFLINGFKLETNGELCFSFF